MVVVKARIGTARQLHDPRAHGIGQPAVTGPPAENDADSEAAHQAWQQQHEAEIVAEEGKPFELVGKDEDEVEDQEPDPNKLATAGGVTVPSTPAHSSAIPGSSSAMAAMALSAQPRAKASVDERKLSVLQKIARMKASERVKAAFSGSRDERMILIRDGARVVQNAVLASPKLTDPEVETFARNH